MIEKEAKSPLCQERKRGRELKLFQFLEEGEMENQGQGRMIHTYNFALGDELLQQIPKEAFNLLVS